MTEHDAFPPEHPGAVRARRIQILWEVTQALIAVGVTGTTLFVAGRLALVADGGTSAQLLLSNAFFLVIGYYFGRHRAQLGQRSEDHPSVTTPEVRYENRAAPAGDAAVRERSARGS